MLTIAIILRFIFATESYGGHYGPAFVTYFDEQNAKIQSGTLQAEQLKVSALMINKCASMRFRPLISLICP